MRAPMGLNDAISDWTKERERATHLMLDAGAVSLALVHAAAQIGEAATICDVLACSRVGRISEWVWQLLGTAMDEGEAVRRTSTRPRFVEVRSGRSLAKGIATEYHLAIYEEDRFVARFVALAAKPTEALRRSLNSVASTLQRRAVHADRALRSARPSRTGFAVFCENGRLQYADDVARKWLEVHAVKLSVGHEIVQLAARKLRSATFSALGLVGKLNSLQGCGGTVYLGELCPAQSPVLKGGSHLTPMQRRVADYAASGSTVGEIARSLVVAPETVRSHMREIYRRLNVSNRIELSRAMEEGPWAGTDCTEGQCDMR